MKKLQLLSIFFLLCSTSFSQTKWMVVDKKSGGKDSIAVDLINSITFKTIGNTISDADGNIYHTVIIGNQEWTVENLKSTKYYDGTPITKITTSNTAWSSTTNGAYCAFDNNESNVSIYGYLYNWHAVNTNKLAPLTGGWRVPADADWQTLVDFLGGEESAAGKMKEIGTNYWFGANLDATNSSGFSGRPGGTRGSDGVFGNVGNYGYWWTSTEFETIAWSRYLRYEYVSVYRGVSKTLGLSVRLVRDLN